jgi:hypothetical protein
MFNVGRKKDRPAACEGLDLRFCEDLILDKVSTLNNRVLLSNVLYY